MNKLLTVTLVTLLTLATITQAAAITEPQLAQLLTGGTLQEDGMVIGGNSTVYRHVNNFIITGYYAGVVPDTVSVQDILMYRSGTQ